jgi:hypothetical protein
MDPDLLTKIPAHELPIWLAQWGDAIEDGSPDIEIIALVDDTVVLIKGKLCAAIHSVAGILLEAHHHYPIKKHIPPIHHNGEDVHIKLFAAFSQPAAHRHEFCLSLHPLNDVFKDDVIMIVGEQVRPVRFTLAVIGP